MRQWGNELIDMCITSPPYWSLRNYKTKSLIWGGKSNCKHKWCKYPTKLAHENRQGLSSKDVSLRYKSELHGYHKQSLKYCLKCGAWRGQLGLEPTVKLYIEHLCTIFDEVRRVLKSEGSLWVNLGDTYNSQSVIVGRRDRSKYGGKSGLHCLRGGTQNIPAKSLCCIPFRFAIEMVDRGWILRNVVIWHKPNSMPSSIKDRFTVDFEYLFFFVKSNKTLFWTNKKTLRLSTTRALGTKGKKGEDWEWRTASNYKGYSFNVRVRDSHLDKYIEKASPSEIALKHGYDPEGICPVCKRKWKRHATPNARDRKKEIRREFIPCISKKTAKSKGRRKRVSLWLGHCYYFEQQFEKYKNSTLERAKYNSYSKKTDTGIHGGMTLKTQLQSFKKISDGVFPGRNKRSVWSIPTQPCSDAHFAAFPEKLVETPIKAGCPELVCKKCGKAKVKILDTEYKGATSYGGKSSKYKNRKIHGNLHIVLSKTKFNGYVECGCDAGFSPGIVLDPFAGRGTTGIVAKKLGRRYILIELSREYVKLCEKNLRSVE